MLLVVFVGVVGVSCLGWCVDCKLECQEKIKFVKWVSKNVLKLMMCYYS